MKAEEFDKIVKARTDERVNTRIEGFRESVYGACRKFFNYSDHEYQRGKWHDEYRKVLQILSSEENKKGWPPQLWKKEREKVADELLSAFDEFTKAKLAAEAAKEPENKMEVVKEPSADLPSDLEAEDDDTPF